MPPSSRFLSRLALCTLAACASAPSLAPSVARLQPVSPAPSAFASDSLDILQCAQRIGASGGFFVEDTTGTVLVRRPGNFVDRLHGTAPVRRPAAVPAQGPVTVYVRPSDARQVRILISPRFRWGWARANARAPGSGAASTRELVRLMNSRCTLHRADSWSR